MILRNEQIACPTAAKSVLKFCISERTIHTGTLFIPQKNHSLYSLKEWVDRLPYNPPIHLKNNVLAVIYQKNMLNVPALQSTKRNARVLPCRTNNPPIPESEKYRDFIPICENPLDRGVKFPLI